MSNAVPKCRSINWHTMQIDGWVARHPVQSFRDEEGETVHRQAVHYEFAMVGEQDGRPHEIVVSSDWVADALGQFQDFGPGSYRYGQYEGDAKWSIHVNKNHWTPPVLQPGMPPRIERVKREDLDRLLETSGFDPTKNKPKGDYGLPSEDE